MKPTIIFLLAFFLFSCQSNTEKKTDTITVSILPQKFIIDFLSDSTISVQTLIPSGANPATYEPTVKQMKNISGSKVYMSIGHLLFEKIWLPKFKETNPNLIIYNLSEKLQLIQNHEKNNKTNHTHNHQIDPHTWISPKQMKLISNEIFEILESNYPEKSDILNENFILLQDTLSKIDSITEQKLKDFKNKKFLIYHPALSYFAKDYNLEQISIEFEGKDFSPSYLKQVIETVQTEKLKAIFVQREFSKDNAQTLSNELNLQLIEINPLAYNYFEFYYQLLENITFILTQQNE